MATKTSMAAYVDLLIMSGTTWENLAKSCKAEATKRGLTVYTKPGDFKTHIAYRRKHLGWQIEESESGVRGNPPTKPEKAAKAKPAAAKAKPKTGKPTGRKVVKTTNGDRQAVAADASVPIGAQRDDSTSEPV